MMFEYMVDMTCTALGGQAVKQVMLAKIFTGMKPGPDPCTSGYLLYDNCVDFSKLRQTLCARILHADHEQMAFGSHETCICRLAGAFPIMHAGCISLTGFVSLHRGPE